jgi:hypothetical protein
VEHTWAMELYSSHTIDNDIVHGISTASCFLN